MDLIKDETYISTKHFKAFQETRVPSANED